MPPSLRRAALPLTTLAVLGAAAPAAAAPQELPLTQLFAGALTPAAGTTTAACQASYRPGAPGIATREVESPTGLAILTARMTGGADDVDLAIFDGSGKAIAGGASPDAQEVAEGYTAVGGKLRLQACRREGTSGSVRVLLERAVLETSAKDVAAAKADPPQLVDVVAPTRAERTRVAQLGLDLTEHSGRTSVGVVLHDAADRAKLTRAGLKWNVVVPDLVADDLVARRAESKARSSRTAARGLPSGPRTTYRTLTDYETELKALADANPGLVKLITLKNKTLSGRDVMGIEITTDVNVADGKPGFLNMGVHHAREWPAGENAMEWAYELVNGFKNGDARMTNIVRSSRNYVVPIVNPDGFNASRTAGALPLLTDTDGDDGRDESLEDTAYIVAGAANGGEYRRKNCHIPGTETANCLTSAGLAENGVDPNRNYGGLWGGPGADATNVTAQTYRGDGPFSEKETQNVKELVGSTQIMSLITNHTTAGLVLRAPGIASLGDPVDENRGYKALGDAMAKENGYFSQKSYELYDTTGGTEDWTYNTAGGFGFTFEIFCDSPNYATGDCDDPSFHPSYARVVQEYEGTSSQADHLTDPGRSEANPFGNVAKYDGKGNREAYKIAAESAIDTARHAVLSGTAPAGVTLRLKKTFKTKTFPGATPAEFDDQLESTLDVGSTGAFKWHVNPSTRPIVARSRGDANGGTPSPPITQSGSIAGSPSDPNDDGVAVFNPAAPGAVAANYNDHPFTIPAGGDNRSATVRIAWATPASDWDMTVYEATADGSLGRPVGTSATGTTNEELVNIPVGGLTAGKRYVARVDNFAAAESYAFTVTFAGPLPFEPAQVEAYTLTCERAGQVLDTQQVVIDRGDAKQLTLGGGCATAAGGAAGGAGNPAGNASGVAGANATAGRGTTPAACVAGGGFKAVAATPAGAGARLAFTRKVAAKATVSVFQQSSGRTITGERLVARFTGKSASFTWNGRANQRKRKVADGYYFVRYTIGSGATKDIRRVVLERRRGRFVKRSDFYRRATCDALPSFKLERPVFGGRSTRPLGISFRLANAAKVGVTVSRGTKVVKRFAVTQRRANTTHRLSLPAKGLPRGEYRVRISVPSGGKTLTSTLTGRRL